MATTTILHEYEAWLKGRRERGEITESTYFTYLNDASRVFEILLRNLPPGVVEGYMQAAGYRSSYKHIINTLRLMARTRGRVAFTIPDPAQPSLPGIDEMPGSVET